MVLNNFFYMEEDYRGCARVCFVISIDIYVRSGGIIFYCNFLKVV